MNLVEPCAVWFLVLFLMEARQGSKAIRGEEFAPLSRNVWALRHSWVRFIPHYTAQEPQILTLLLTEIAPSAWQLFTISWWLNTPREWAAHFACPGTLKLQVPRPERNLFSCFLHNTRLWLQLLSAAVGDGDKNSSSGVKLLWNSDAKVFAWIRTDTRAGQAEQNE